MLKRRLKVSPKDLQCLLVFALITTVATSSVAYTTLFPRPGEQFFAMWVLGSRGFAQDYYPNDNSTLAAGELVDWTLGVYNHMNQLEYIVIRVKLLNSTSVSPDELTGTPSPVPEVFEVSRILLANETWSIPFAWRIMNLTLRDQSLLISGLSLNGTLLSGSLGSAISGINFRLVFELWFYDQNSNALTFTWNANGVNHSVWTQIWFNATMTS